MTRQLWRENFTPSTRSRGDFYFNKYRGSQEDEQYSKCSSGWCRIRGQQSSQRFRNSDSASLARAFCSEEIKTFWNHQCTCTAILSSSTSSDQFSIFATCLFSASNARIPAKYSILSSENTSVSIRKSDVLGRNPILTHRGTEDVPIHSSAAVPCAPSRRSYEFNAID
jgi:hypothetical protein